MYINPFVFYGVSIILAMILTYIGTVLHMNQRIGSIHTLNALTIKDYVNKISDLESHVEDLLKRLLAEQTEHETLYSRLNETMKRLLQAKVDFRQSMDSHRDLTIERDQLVLERDCLAEKALELWDKVKSNLWCDSSAALKAEAVGLCAKKLFSENLVSASTIEVVDLTDDSFAAKYGDVAWCRAAIEALRSFNTELEETASSNSIPFDGSMNLVVDEDKKATYRSTKVKQQPPMRSEDNK